MSDLRRNFSVAILVLLASVIAMGAIPVHSAAVSPCTVVFQTGTKTGIAPGTSGLQLTYSLVYPYNYPSAGTAASFGLSVGSSNTAWTVVGVSPLLVPGEGTSTSFDWYPVTVTVNAPNAPGSTTILTVTATDEQSQGRGCSLQTTLTTSGTPNTVPEFPLGMLALLGLAIPTTILLKRKFSIATPA